MGVFPMILIDTSTNRDVMALHIKRMCHVFLDNYVDNVGKKIQVEFLYYYIFERGFAR
jgi:hypothetical protein